MSPLTAVVVLAVVGALVCMALRLRRTAPYVGRGADWTVTILAAAAILGYGLIAQDCRRSGDCAPRRVQHSGGGTMSAGMIR